MLHVACTVYSYQEWQWTDLVRMQREAAKLRTPCKIYSFKYMQKVRMRTNILSVCQFDCSLMSLQQHVDVAMQWCASIGGACSLGTMAAPRHSNVEKLLQKIEESQIGYNSTLQGPFGTKKGTCMIEARYSWSLLMPAVQSYICTQLCTQITLHLESKCIFPAARCESTFWPATVLYLERSY